MQFFRYKQQNLTTLIILSIGTILFSINIKTKFINLRVIVILCKLVYHISYKS